MEHTRVDLEGQIDISLQATEILPASPASQEKAPRHGGLALLQRYQHIIIGGLLFFAALGFDLYRLGTPSIWFDEAFSVELSRQPLPLLWHTIFGPEPNMELYYLFLHFWLQVTGILGMIPTEFLVRLPSAIFAAFSVLVLFLMGRRFLGPWAGFAGASLYALNYFQLVYAQQTRAYSLQLLLLCLAWYALFVAFTQETHHKRWWTGYALITTLAFYAQLFSALAICAQVVAITGLALLPNAWRVQIRKRFPAFVVSLLACGILSAPLILVSSHGSKATGWLPVPHLHDILTLFLNIGSNSKIYLALIAVLCGLGLFVSCMAYFPPIARINKFLLINVSEKEEKGGRQQLPVVLALLCWFFLPIILSFVISQGRTHIFSTRYLVIVVPPLCLLVGAGVGALRLPAAKIILALAMIALALHYTPLYYQNAQIENWNTASYWLTQRYHPGDGLVCYTNAQGCQIAMEYYFTRYQSDAHFDADTPGAFSWENDGPANQMGYEAAVDPAALAAYGTHHPRLFFIVARLSGQADALKAGAARTWLNSHYHFVEQIVTPTITIRLYTTTTGAALVGP